METFIAVYVIGCMMGLGASLMVSGKLKYPFVQILLFSLGSWITIGALLAQIVESMEKEDEV